MGRTLRVTVAAATDVRQILEQSERTFGAAARSRYARLVASAMDLLREGEPAASLARPELGPGVRTFHLRLCQSAGTAVEKVRDPRHLIVYSADERSVLVLRLLHERMDLPRHVPAAERGPRA